MTAQALRSKWAGYVVAVLGIVIVTAVLRLLDNHINATTVALAMLLVVLFVATLWGVVPLFSALCWASLF